MDLSVVIVSYNVKDYLEQALLSAKRAASGIDCEIFVVDNNSDDDSCRMVEEGFPEVILIRNGINKGFSFANNQAIRQASGRYVLLLNPDTIVEDDTFRKCLAFMNSHPEAGAAGVKMADGNGRFLPESKRSLPTASSAFFKTFGISRLFPGSPLLSRYHLPQIDSDETSVVEVLSGAFMFIRAETLAKTGLLDEDFFMYGEDIDLSFRIMKAGYLNYYFPSVAIVHFKGKSTGRNGYADVRHFYGAMRIYIRKRSAEGGFRYLKFFLIQAVNIREGVALLGRFVRIRLKRYFPYGA